MYNDIVTCFVNNNNPNEIVSTSFNLKNNLTIEYSSTTEKINSANLIRSTLSEDKKKALVCFYDNDAYVYCSIYDITINKFTEIIKIFNLTIIENSETLKVKYIKEKKEYIIFANVENKYIEIIKLDENYNIKSDNDEYEYCYTEQSLTNCNKFLSFDIYYSDIKNNYYTIAGCDDNTFINQSLPEKCNIELENNIGFYNKSEFSENII